MTGVILSIHIIACVLLILIVLLQTGKGSDMGASFGSASGGQAFFGSTGPATVLSKITTGVAVIFMLTSLTLAYTSGHSSTKSIMPEVTAPVEATKAAAPVEAAESAAPVETATDSKTE